MPPRTRARVDAVMPIDAMPDACLPACHLYHAAPRRACLPT